MDIKIRNEETNDHRAVEEVTREAFWNLYVPGCSEHYLSHVLRGHKDFIRELDLVAEYKGRVIGNIMFTRSWLTDEDGRVMEIATFGPYSVLPKYQRQGVGGALLSQAKKRALKSSVKVIVIFGDPRNYCSHGFKSARDLNISDMKGEYPYGMLALELVKGALRGRKWKYRYSDVYDVNPDDAERFDKGFAKKKKEHLPSQDVFSIAIRSYVH